MSWTPTIKKIAAPKGRKENAKRNGIKKSQIVNIVKPNEQIKKYLGQEFNNYIEYDQFVKKLAEI